MTRYRFGGDITSVVMSVGVADNVFVAGDILLTFWNARTNGDQYIDLSSTVDGPAEFSAVLSTSGLDGDPKGLFYEFYGPDDVKYMYASGGGAARTLIVTNSPLPDLTAGVAAAAPAIAAGRVLEAYEGAGGPSTGRFFEVTTNPVIIGNRDPLLGVYGTGHGSKPGWVEASRVLSGIQGVRAGGGFNGLLAVNLRGLLASSGAPASGTWSVNDSVIDNTGRVWLCTVAGTPGTWVGTMTVITPTVTTLTDAATVTTDASRGNHFRLTMAGNRSLAAPTNPTDGQRCLWEVTASGGARTLTPVTGSAGAFAFGTTITALSATTSGATDIVEAVYHGTANRWRIVSYAKGF